jgi:DNA repair exonuclease SbcCD ATPase subunit
MWKFHTQKYIPSTKSYNDEFHVTAVNEAGADLYEGNSGGEQRKIDVCISFALKYLAQVQTSNTINILLLDEVFEAVDLAGQDRIIDLLSHLSKEIESIFVVTRLDVLSSIFDNTLTIVKDNKDYSYVKS